MKYFTKEWYELCQKSSFHLALEEEQQAETYSEKYFQQLYNTELKSWLDLQEEVATIMKNNETINTTDNKEETFNTEKAIGNFHDGFIYNQEQLQEKLPETIGIALAKLKVYLIYL
ncbi:hypothetical protein M3231_03970 [Neobacillus mesonae]|nr:hypothetical protein [Neobacillus mesonae]